MHPFARRCAATLVAAAAALTFGAGSASALESCPRGWSERLDPGQTLGSVTQFCVKRSEMYGVSPFYYPQWVYFVKAPADKITQGYRFFMSGEQISNPEFQAQSVQDWMAERAPEGYKLTINGTFYAFDAGSSVHRSAFPFFSRDPVTDVSLLPSVGKDPATEQFRDWRRCISWQRGTRSRVQDGPWTLGTNDFYDIMDRITIPGGPCLVTASGTGETSHGEFVVGFDPRLEVDADSREGPMNTLTLVGVTTHGNGMWNTENLCFLIGGWHTRNNASNMMQEDFGCKPVLQLDGGRSTQFSYVSPQDGRTIVNPIDGCCLLSKRPVPHVLMIR